MPPKVKPPSPIDLLKAALAVITERRDEVFLRLERDTNRIDVYNTMITHLEGALNASEDL